MLAIRPATDHDHDAIWGILEPIIRAGETYTLPRETTKQQALGYWHANDHHVFVAEDDISIVGTYFLRANQQGGGSHVANCGYATLVDARDRGIATAMCRHSLQEASGKGFRAMQFNFVIS